MSKKYFKYINMSKKRNNSKTKKRVSPKFVKGAVKTIKDFKDCKYSHCGAKNIVEAKFNELINKDDYKTCNKLAFNSKVSLKKVNDCFDKTEYNIETKKYQECISGKCSKLKEKYEEDNKIIKNANTDSFDKIMDCEKNKCATEKQIFDNAEKVCNTKLTNEEYNKCKEIQKTKELFKKIDTCSKKKCSSLHKADSELLKTLTPYYKAKYPKTQKSKTKKNSKS